MYLPDRNAESGREPAVAPQPAPVVSTGRFAVAREMLSTLETLTNAGQRHLMAKVVAIIEGQVAETAPDTSGSRRSGSMALLAQLKRESSRLLPDLTTFRSHANELIALLAPPNR